MSSCWFCSRVVLDLYVEVSGYGEAGSFRCRIVLGGRLHLEQKPVPQPLRGVFIFARGPLPAHGNHAGLAKILATARTARHILRA